ncbi:MAG: HNH endonuclease, partial [Planctomycetes bacterium]|nr:HNH endonuclease [Planctomycetota bacterium]
YPTDPHIRRHGPIYARYESYRPWLRDEFSFRCVYCLKREQWGILRGTFDIDHFLPQQTAPGRMTDYDNLVYSCAGCNAAKRALVLPDPSQVLVYPNVVVHSDGRIQGRSSEAKAMIEQLDLDGPAYREYRRLMIDIVALARRFDVEVYEKLLGFPDTLPDLSAKRPQANRRPGGVQHSFRARQKRGELPSVY